MEFPKPQEKIKTLSRLSTDDLEWNLKEEKKRLQEMLANGATEQIIQETQETITKVEKELSFRSENN
jgi:cobalamin-dependent methionine synthase I